MTPAAESSRRLASGILITVAVAAACGRILSAELVFEPSLHRDAEDTANPAARVWPKKRPEPMPTFSSNDRSRWATVRALVEKHTYVVGERDPNRPSKDPNDPDKVRPYTDEGIIFDDGWKSVDKVLKPGTNEFYSSKPPLLPTLVAGEYWLLYRLGWTITGHPWTVVRVILLTVNALPFLVYLVLLARLLERYGTTEWGRLYALAAGCFATLVTPFLVTFNNHTVATFSALFALYPAVRILEAGALASGSPLNGKPPWYLFALAGFFAAFTACNELPAAAFAGLLFLVLLVRSPWRTLAYFVPAAAVPVAAFFVTNYLAVGELRPAYEKFGTEWYTYEGSHWRVEPGQVKRGIDWAGHPQGANESKATYAFHLLLGHHGLFSLTPVVLLAVAGMAAGVRGQGSGVRGQGGKGGASVPRVITVMTLVLTVIVVGFYIIKSDNYGGWSAGPRWLMWLTPFWLLTMLPVADHLAGCRWGRALAYVLLAVSVLSVSYPAWNPWRQPWIYNYMEAQGWIHY